MATSSFFRNIELKTEKQVLRFVEALEKSEKISDRKTALRHPVREVKREEAAKLFVKIKW